MFIADWYSGITAIIFAILYWLDAVIRFIALGTEYFRDPWNIFDLLIAITSVLELAISNPSAVVVFQCMRVVRVAKLARVSAGLRLMLHTLLSSFSSLFHIAALLFLVMFIYAALGVTFWGNVKYGAELVEQNSFQTFPLALLVLFRMSTGEAWNVIMTDCEVQPPACNMTLGVCTVLLWFVVGT